MSQCRYLSCAYHWYLTACKNTAPADGITQEQALRTVGVKQMSYEKVEQENQLTEQEAP